MPSGRSSNAVGGSCAGNGNATPNVVSMSGGAGIWGADTVALQGLQVPELSQAIQAEIKKLLPSYGAAGNPIDVTAQYLASRLIEWTGNESAVKDGLRKVNLLGIKLAEVHHLGVGAETVDGLLAQREEFFHRVLAARDQHAGVRDRGRHRRGRARGG